MEHAHPLESHIESSNPLSVDTLLPARRSLRVAVVSETYPPEVNGVAMTLARVVEGLHQRGHEVQLVRPRQDARDDGTQEMRFAQVLMRGLPIPRYPQLKLGLPSQRALLKLWNTQRPDVVHIVTEGPLGYSALKAALRLKLPLVSDFRTNFHAYSRHYGVAWLRNPIMAYLRKFHNRTASTMVPTDALRSELALSGFRNLRVVARGVDTVQFDPAKRSAALRQQWGVEPEQMVVLHVGRMASEKNLKLLLQAFAALQGVEPRARLVLVGDGPERESLQQQCPTAVFAGVRRGDDLARHYASSDVFLFPSLTETFGNVVPEAMASGLPVVAFDCAAAKQLIQHGENGMLVALADAPGFCTTSARLAGQLDWVRAMGARARKTASQLDWSHIVEQVESEYQCAITLQAAAAPPALQPAMPY